MPAKALMSVFVKTWGLFAIWLALAACTVMESGRVKKIALLAPFEGPHRAIGYNALYALRLARADAGGDVQLLAVDDGGTVDSALKRMQALNLDPAVAAILALGQAASHPSVQQVNDRPLIIIGSWGHDRADEHTFYAAHPSIAQQRLDSDLRLLGPGPYETALVSSGRPADADFQRRYMQSDLHAPAPNLLATVIYDMGRLALGALESAMSIDHAQHEGLNGTIQFVDGYWQDAPRRVFRYDGERLVMLSDEGSDLSDPSTTP